MSQASNYNTRPRAAEVLVDGSAAKVIRRRETWKDLFAPEVL
jgi:diaminopimelate decarboxylase